MIYIPPSDEAAPPPLLGWRVLIVLGTPVNAVGLVG